MADGSPGNVPREIVTLNSLQPPETEGLESAGRAGEETPASQLALARYYQIMERLRQETQEKGTNLLITVRIARPPSSRASSRARPPPTAHYRRADSRRSSGPDSPGATGSAGFVQPAGLGRPL